MCLGEQYGCQQKLHIGHAQSMTKPITRVEFVSVNMSTSCYNAPSRAHTAFLVSDSHSAVWFIDIGSLGSLILW